MTPAELDALTIIRAHGGTVRHSFFSGWLGGVRGLRLNVVQKLVDQGVLHAERAPEGTRRSRRSKGLPTIVTAYTIV